MGATCTLTTSAGVNFSSMSYCLFFFSYSAPVHRAAWVGYTHVTDYDTGLDQGGSQVNRQLRRSRNDCQASTEFQWPISYHTPPGGLICE